MNHAVAGLAARCVQRSLESARAGAPGFDHTHPHRPFERPRQQDVRTMRRFASSWHSAAMSANAAPFRFLGLVAWLGFGFVSRSADFALLKPAAFAHHIERFNATDDEAVVNAVPNRDARDWLWQNIPLFECPDRELEEIYYFRWWSFRKHLVRTPAGFVITEFLTPVRHAGRFNTISCAAGFHLTEGRWLRDDRYVNDYIRFWLRGDEGAPQPHFHNYSGWFAAAVWDRYRVNGDRRFVINLLPDLIKDYRLWAGERQLTNGLFWQFDVRDGMEESISGSRTRRNVRPTINSYQFANAQAIAEIARLAGETQIAGEFAANAADLKRLTQEALWDQDAGFFKVQFENGHLSDAREAIGFVPWMFGLPEVGRGYEVAWAQITDPRGFAAPAGLTTAERRHPEFRSRGWGTCEWDGAVWPFATSQTLAALANLLRDYPQRVVTRQDYFSVFLTYTRSQRTDGRPYIGEYLDEVTGDWINGRGDRSRCYNHSTYADPLITGVVGLRPRSDDLVEIDPLLPAETWDWLCLDGIKYRGRLLAVVWDRDGSRYGQGAGLRLLANGQIVVKADRLERLRGKLP
jgi:hypothetical protein